MADPVVSITNGVPTSGTGTITTLGQTIPPAGTTTTSVQGGPMCQGAVTTSAPSYTTAQVNALSLNTSGGLRVDGSGVTQPVSGTFWQATQPISGTITANQGGAWTVAATQSGNWTSRIVGNAGGVLDFAGQNAAAPANSLLIGGEFNTTPTTITSGNASPLQLDNAGNLLVNVKAGGAAGGTSSNFNATFPTTGTAAGAEYLNSPPVLTSGQMVALQTDINGNLKVNISSQIAQVTWNSGTALNSVYNLTINNSIVWNSLCGSIDCTTTLTAGAVTFEESYDFGTSWVSIPAGRVINPSSGAQLANPLTLAASTNFPWEVVCTSTNYVRLRLSTAIVGTGQVTISTTQEAGANAVTVFQPVAGNLLCTASQGGTSWTVGGDTASGATDAFNPVKIGGLAKTTQPTAVTDGQRVNATFDKQGKQIVAGAIRQLKGVQKTSITVATETTVVTAGAAGVFNDVYAIVVTNKSATSVFIDFKDATAGTTRMTLAAPANDTRGFTVPVDSAMVQAVAANNWTATVSSAVTSIEVTMLYTQNQ